MRSEQIMAAFQEHAIAHQATKKQADAMEHLLARALAAVQRGEMPSQRWQTDAEMMIRLINQDRKERRRTDEQQ
jgi:hypothetical protein